MYLARRLTALPLEQIGAGAFQNDRSDAHDAGAIPDPQRQVGELLDEQYGDTSICRCGHDR